MANSSSKPPLVSHFFHTGPALSDFNSLGSLISNPITSSSGVLPPPLHVIPPTLVVPLQPCRESSLALPFPPQWPVAPSVRTKIIGLNSHGKPYTPIKIPTRFPKKHHSLLAHLASPTNKISILICLIHPRNPACRVLKLIWNSNLNQGKQN